MFIGEYIYNLDSKKRLAIPALLRKEIGMKAVLTRGLDSCLFLYTHKEWGKLAEKLGNLSMGQSATRSFVRVLLSGAVQVSFDRLGRILIPDYLKNYAQLKKRIIIAGLYNRLEIWDEDQWERYKRSAERDADKIAERLGELGMI